MKVSKYNYQTRCKSTHCAVLIVPKNSNKYEHKRAKSGLERTVSIKDPRYSDIDAILMMETVRQGFSDALTLIVTSAYTNGVDMTPAKC